MKHFPADSALIFIPKWNSHGKRDVTGAFRPEAKRFAAMFGDSHIHEFDNRQSMAKRRKEVFGVFDHPESPFHSGSARYDTVAFFCHGWSNGIQAGFTRKTVDRLAHALRARATGAAAKSMVVPLYCCSTGDDPEDRKYEAAGTSPQSAYHDGSGPGEGSFGDQLRDSMCELGMVSCRVMAHTTVAHTTKNPDVIWFDGMGSEYGGVGGYAPVGRKSKLWKPWRRALQKTDLRFTMPYKRAAETHAILAKGVK